MNNNESLKLNNLIYIILITAFIACYYHTFLWLHYKYSSMDSYYSHGYLIPFISFYIIYAKRDKIKKVKFSSDINGLVIIIFTLPIHIVAVMSDINFISGFSNIFSSLYVPYPVLFYHRLLSLFFGEKSGKASGFSNIFSSLYVPYP